jgi:hypothetical protein
MARIDISAQIRGDRELSEFLAALSGKQANSVIHKAIKAGVRDAARAGRTTLAKSIGQRYSLSAGRIKQDVPNARVASDGQSAVITTSRKPITAMQFKPLQTKKGLSMRIFRGGKRTLIKSGFMAKGLPFRRKGKERLPLETIYGPSIHAIYTGGKWSPALQARTELRIEDALEKGILRSLGAMGRGYGRS